MLNLRSIFSAAVMIGIAISLAFFGPKPLMSGSDARANDASTTTQNSAPTSGQRHITLAVSLTWEGRDLYQHNLAAIQKFRQQFSDIDMVHFISPAYFLKPNVKAEAAAAQIRSTLNPRDEVGILVGGWRSVAQKAEVIFRKEPTFWGNKIPDTECKIDCGQEVPLSVYSKTDISKIFKTSMETLGSQGFTPAPIQTFAIQGWAATPEVLEAAAAHGLRYDFSAVPPQLLVRNLRAYPIYQWVKDLWSGVTPHSQPYILATSTSSITEMPRNMAAMDYLTDEETISIFREYIERTKRGDKEVPLTFHLAFYQETAASTVPIIMNTLQKIFAISSENNIGLKPLILRPRTGSPNLVNEKSFKDKLAH